MQSSSLCLTPWQRNHVAEVGMWFLKAECKWDQTAQALPSPATRLILVRDRHFPMSETYDEYSDRMLLEEHAAHPERFAKYRTMKNPDTMTEAELRKYAKNLLKMIHVLQETLKKLTP